MRLPRICLPALGAASAALLLAACASKETASSSQAPKVSVGAAGESVARPAPIPVSAPAATIPAPRREVPKTEAPRKPSTPPQPAPSPSPTPDNRKDNIGDLIRLGKVESASNNTLVVKKSGAVEASETGLFEDAIIQNRVRAALIADGHPQAAESVRVSGGVVDLDLRSANDPSRAAAAVDAALGVNGVTKARVATSE